jgi:hypothetical protein
MSTPDEELDPAILSGTDLPLGMRQRRKGAEDDPATSTYSVEDDGDDADEDGEAFDDFGDLSDLEEEDEIFDRREGERATGRARVAEVKATIQEEQRERALASGAAKSLSFQKRLGAAVQRPEIQVIMLILICIDVAAALMQIFLSNGIIPGAKTSTMVRVGKFLEYESAVTIMVFMIEMLVAVISFGFALLSHPGYTLDLVVVIAQVYFAAVYDSVGVRLLGILRLWRLLRLVDKILEDEKDAHAYTLEQLDRDRARVDDLLAQLREKDHALKHEKEKLNRANEMLRNYKDDNAWLVDALHIAAEHAAGSGMPQGPSTVPVSGLRGMDVPVNSGGRGGNSSTPASAAPKKSSKSKRPKIKIGKDGVQRLVRE